MVAVTNQGNAIATIGHPILRGCSLKFGRCFIRMRFKLSRSIHTFQLYAVKDRTPRVYPWMNEPDGGIMPLWNTQKQLTVYTILGTMWFGFANTAVGS
jgi:hypothetical protein